MSPLSANARRASTCSRHRQNRRDPRRFAARRTPVRAARASAGRTHEITRIPGARRRAPSVVQRAHRRPDSKKRGDFAADRTTARDDDSFHLFSPGRQSAGHSTQPLLESPHRVPPGGASYGGAKTAWAPATASGAVRHPSRGTETDVDARRRLPRCETSPVLSVPSLRATASPRQRSPETGALAAHILETDWTCVKRAGCEAFDESRGAPVRELRSLARISSVGSCEKGLSVRRAPT